MSLASVAKIRATILSAVLFGLYYANYVEGWVTVDMLPGYRAAP